MTARGSTTYASNGDGTIVSQATSGVTTRYIQDLAAPLPQVLQTTQGSATTQYVYGRARVASVAGGTRTWYGTDALGSVRQTLDDAGVPLSVINYDPWGTPRRGRCRRSGLPWPNRKSGMDAMKAEIDNKYASRIGNSFAQEPNTAALAVQRIIAAYDAQPMGCPPAVRLTHEPIILVGHSRGAATVQAAAAWLNRLRPDIKIDLVITLSLTAVFQPEAPLYKLPNVQRHINTKSHFGTFMQTGYTSTDFGLGFPEASISGAEELPPIREAAHEYLDYENAPAAC